LPKSTFIDVAGVTLTLKEDIQQKHKFALYDFNIGDEIFMYGVLVGKAMKSIAQGEAITTENLKHASAAYDANQEKFTWSAPDASKFKSRTFNGFPRKDGSVGTRNYWLVIPLTFCENRNLDVLEGALLDVLGYETKKDFSVNTSALIDKYKSGATAEDLLATDIISTKEEISKNRLFPNVSPRFGNPL